MIASVIFDRLGEVETQSWKGFTAEIGAERVCRQGIVAELCRAEPGLRVSPAAGTRV